MPPVHAATAAVFPVPIAGADSPVSRRRLMVTPPENRWATRPATLAVVRVTARVWSSLAATANIFVGAPPHLGKTGVSLLNLGSEALIDWNNIVYSIAYSVRWRREWHVSLPLHDQAVSIMLDLVQPEG